MQLPIEQLMKRASRGFSERDQNRDLFEDCYDYYLPYKDTYEKHSQTHQKPTRQYDSTGMHSAFNFVNTLQENFTPVFSKWGEMKAGPGIQDSKSRKKFNEAAEEINDKFFTYLNSSNFSSTAAEMYFDWGIGTGCLWFHEGDEQHPFRFQSTPMSSMGLVEGKHGTIDSRFREFNIKPRLIEATFKGFRVKLPEEIQAMKASEKEEDVRLIECCYWDEDDFVWRYEVLHEGSKSRIVEEAFGEEICFTPRWMKIPGHAFGVGPLIFGLPDVKTLNKMKEYMLRNAALSVFGVYTVTSSGVFNPNNVRVAPNAFIPVERNGGANGPSIAPLPRTGSFDIQEFMMRDLQESVRKTLLDTKLPEPQATPTTAFEIAQRIREFQQDIGAAYGRGMYEFIIPFYRRGINILNRKGLITLPDNFTIDNYFVQVQVVSPIAQTQAMQEIERLTQAYQMTAAISPELAMMSFDIESMPQWLVEKLGAPSDKLRSDADKTALQQAIAQALAAQQQAQQG